MLNFVFLLQYSDYIGWATTWNLARKNLARTRNRKEIRHKQTAV